VRSFPAIESFSTRESTIGREGGTERERERERAGEGAEEEGGRERVYVRV